MASRKAPPAGYLDQFQHPLWKRLRLGRPTAEWIVESDHAGWAFTALGLRHSHTGVLSAQWATQLTTFLILPLPPSPAPRRLGWMPDGYQLSIDDGHLYVAQPGRELPVNEWRDVLDLAIQAAESMVECTASDVETDLARTLSTPVDDKATLFWLVVAGVLPGLMVAWGIGLLHELLSHGYLQDCGTTRTLATIRHGWAAWQYVLSLLLPAPGLAMMLWALFRYRGRSFFALRIAPFALIVWLLVFLGLHYGFGGDKPGTQLPNGEAVRCRATY